MPLTKVHWANDTLSVCFGGVYCCILGSLSWFDCFLLSVVPVQVIAWRTVSEMTDNAFVPSFAFIALRPLRCVRCVRCVGYLDSGPPHSPTLSVIIIVVWLFFACDHQMLIKCSVHFVEYCFQIRRPPIVNIVLYCYRPCSPVPCLVGNF